MRRLARLAPVLVVLGAFVLPAVAAAESCGSLTCTANQNCVFDDFAGYSCVNSSGSTAPNSPINSGPSAPSNPVINSGPSVNTGGTLYNPLGDNTTLWDLTLKILNFIIEIGAVVIVFVMVYVGFLFVTAQGNESKLTAAKQALLWTIVGALVLLGSKAITYGICQTVQALSTNGTVTCRLL